MFQYVVRRVLLFIPTLFLITVISFGISRLAPGDPAEMKAGVGAEGAQRGNAQLNETMIKQIRAAFDLDKPIWYWTIFNEDRDADGMLKPLGERLTWKWNGSENQYHRWLGLPNADGKRGLLQLDFGKSFQDQRPVMEKIMERMPVTITISVLSILIAYLIAVPIGIWSAARPKSKADKIVSTFLFIIYSLPGFWIGTMLIIFMGGGDFLDWFPNSGLHSMDYSADWSWWESTSDYLWHLALPLVVSTYASLAYLSRQMRGSMLEVIRQDYIRTARAKGLAERTVVLKHALRNSLIPIITMLASILPALVGGSVIVETIFTVPGMGQLAFQALTARDYPVVLAEFTLVAIMTLAGILVADILYSVVDPRISFNKKAA
jgi:peptide/nickel transport system permease protein